MGLSFLIVLIATAILSVLFLTQVPTFPAPANHTKSTVSLVSPAKQNTLSVSPTPRTPSDVVSAPPKELRSEVRIVEAPPISVRKDWADWGVWLFSGFLALVSGLQAFLLFKTLKVSQAQTELSRKTLISTFRPKLIVRSVQIFTSAPDKPDDSNKVTYDVVNIGYTSAKIVHSEVCVRYQTGISNYQSPDSALNILDQLENYSIAPGAYKTASIELFGVVEAVEFLEKMCKLHVTNPELVGQVFLTGRIDYHDEMGTKRQLAFHRSYRPTTKRFSIVSDPDYEYSD